MNPIFIPLTLTAICIPALARESRIEREEGHPPPPPLPIFKALDQDRDYSLSESEIANAAEILRKLDKNGDGRIEPHEIQPKRPAGERRDRPPRQQNFDAPRGESPHGHPPQRPRD